MTPRYQLMLMVGCVLEGLDGSVLDTVIRSKPGLTMTQNYSTDILRGPGNQDRVFSSFYDLDL